MTTFYCPPPADRRRARAAHAARTARSPRSIGRARSRLSRPQRPVAVAAKQAYYELAYQFRRPPIPSNSHPERSVGFLVTDVAHLLRRNFNRRAQALGLSQAQWRALAHLSRDEGLKQSALAERLEIQPITLTRLIDRMEAAGWVERRSDPTDRRAVRLYLTAQAQPVLAEMQRAAAGMLDEVLRGLSVDARLKLVDALCTMKRNLSDMEGPAAPVIHSTKKRDVRRIRESRAR